MTDTEYLRLRALEQMRELAPGYYGKQPSMPPGMWSVEEVGVPDGTRAPLRGRNHKKASSDLPVVKTGWRDTPSGQSWMK